MLRSHVRPFLVLSSALALVAVSSCKKNHPPNVPAVPAGPEYCFKGAIYTFKTITADPDGDSVAVRFEWGDTTVSDWSGWFGAGDTIALTHVWHGTGTYEITAQARDRKEVTSGWSDALTVTAVLHWPPGAPAEPTGPERGGQDSSYTFGAVAFHPESSTVAIRFAWGDGDSSDWSPFVASGEPVADSHAWSAPGTFAVWAQAKDTGNALSQWSIPHTIIIRPPDTLRKWRLQLAADESPDLYSSPAIGPDGTIYVGSSDSSLYAVSPDGDVKWRLQTGGDVRSSPSVAADGTIYVGSHDNRVYAVNSDGTLKWSYLTSGDVSSCPAIAADGTVYVGSYDDYAYAINSDGTLQWRYMTGGNVVASPALAPDGTSYFGSSTSLHALNPDGTLKWDCETRDDVRSSVAIGSDGALYFGTDSRTLSDFYALNPDGTVKWSLSGDRVRSSPAIGSEGSVYFGSTDNYVYAMNPDGTLKWRYLTGSNVDAGPAVAADGTVYVGSDDHYLYALNSDGTVKWRYETDGNIESSPTIGPDGTVYFTSCDGYLYALKGTGTLADTPWPKFHHDLRNTGQFVGRWNRLRLVGSPQITADSSGFVIRIMNDRPADVTISWLEFLNAPDSAYMRSFYIDGNPGVRFPMPPGIPTGAGPGDTVYFQSPGVTIPSDGLAELLFLDLYDDKTGTGGRANIVGKEFLFRFSDGSSVTVKP